MSEKVVILIPVLNDQDSLTKLVEELSITIKEYTAQFTLLIVDDGSVNGIQAPASNVISSQVLRLCRNIGHQKAIAVGMAYIREHLQFDKVVIMDGDGEDRPEDVLALLRDSAQ